jgi:hypothetical protein
MPNRFKKEEIRKAAEARKGLTPEEVEALDAREKEETDFELLYGNFHTELFPEESDFFYDSIADANDRRQGINPMSKEYQLKQRERIKLKTMEHRRLQYRKYAA